MLAMKHRSLVTAFVLACIGVAWLLGTWNLRSAPADSGIAAQEDDLGPDVRARVVQANSNAVPQDQPGLELDLQWSINDLFNAIDAAARASDDVALTEARELLLQRDVRGVADAALERLRRAEAEWGETAVSDASPKSYRIKLRVNLLYLAAREYPERVFAKLRAIWREPEIGEERRALWQVKNKLHLHILACEALPEEDRIEAWAAADVIVGYARSGLPQGARLYSLIADLYGDEVEPEVPDPWLSEVIAVLGQHRDSMRTEEWHRLRSSLEVLAGNSVLSARLRRQIEVLLVDAPADFWQLLDQFHGASSLEACAEALRRYLSHSGISRSELKLLLQQMFQRHPLGTDGPLRFTENLTQGISDASVVERFHVLAADLLALAEEEPAGTKWWITLEFIEGLALARSSASGIATRRIDIFGGNSRGALNTLLTLRTRADQESRLTVRRAFTDARIIGMVWNLSIPFAEKVSTVQEMLDNRAAVHRSDCQAVVSGLRTYADEAALGPRLSVLLLVDTVITKGQFGSSATSPLTISSWETIVFRDLCVLLNAMELPPIALSSQVALATVAKQIELDCPNWRLPAHLTSFRSDLLALASAIRSVYDHEAQRD